MYGGREGGREEGGREGEGERATCTYVCMKVTCSNYTKVAARLGFFVCRKSSVDVETEDPPTAPSIETKKGGGARHSQYKT